MSAAKSEWSRGSLGDELQAGGYLSYDLADVVARSQGRSLSTWELEQGIAQGIQQSGTASRRELTVGTSPQTVLFTRDTQPYYQVASNLCRARFEPGHVPTRTPVLPRGGRRRRSCARR